MWYHMYPVILETKTIWRFYQILPSSIFFCINPQEMYLIIYLNVLQEIKNEIQI